MRFCRNDIFIQNMHVIKSYVKQWICLVDSDVKIFEKEIVEMILFRLVVRRIYVYINGVQTRVVLAVNSIYNLNGIPADQGFQFGKRNNMRDIILVNDLERNFKTVESRETDIFKGNAKLNLFAQINGVFTSQENIGSQGAFRNRKIIQPPVI